MRGLVAGGALLVAVAALALSASAVEAQQEIKRGAAVGGGVGLLTDGLEGALKGAAIGGAAGAVTQEGQQGKKARETAGKGAAVGAGVGLLTDGFEGALKGAVIGGAAGGIAGGLDDDD